MFNNDTEKTETLHALLRKKEFNRLQTDYTAEALAANLLRHFKKEGSLFIKRLGNNERPYQKDIQAVHLSKLDLDEDVITIETFREGIYDYLPEGIFHRPTFESSSFNVDSIVDEIKQQHKEEEEARRFFQPFEVESFALKVKALLKEFEYDIDSPARALHYFASDIWPLLSKVKPQLAATLIHVIPFLHELRGNKAGIEKLLSAILEVPVHIDFEPNLIKKGSESSLGASVLGVSFITAGSHTDGDLNWRIRIGKIPYKQIDKFLKGSNFRNILNELYDYLLPLSTEIIEVFETEKDSTAFCLDNKRQTNRLGFSTYL